MAKVPQKYKKQIEKLTKIIEHLDDLEDIVAFVANYEKIDRRKRSVNFCWSMLMLLKQRLSPMK